MKKLIITLIAISFSIAVNSQTKLDSLILTLVNEYRLENNLKVLIWDTSAYKVAQNQAEYMAATERLSHDQLIEDSIYFNVIPDFANKFIKYGLTKCHAYENLSVVFWSDTLTIEKVAKISVTGWKNSPIHNKLMLTPNLIYCAIANVVNQRKSTLEIDESGNEVEIVTREAKTWIALDGYGPND